MSICPHFHSCYLIPLCILQFFSKAAHFPYKPIYGGCFGALSGVAKATGYHPEADQLLVF